MTELPVSALDARLQKQVESARAAFERGEDERVVALCRAVLAEAPGCLPVRKLQRVAQLRRASGGGLFARALGSVSAAPFLVTGKLRLGDDPAKALASAERLLEADPHSRAGLALLGDAAAALGWRETAVFAAEARLELDPQDVAVLVALGRAQLAAGRADAAVRAAEAALRLEPIHGPAQALLKDASVAVSLRRGNWEERGDFRGKLKS